MGRTVANMGVATGDVDGDGLLDLFVTHLTDETHTLWRQGPRGQFRDETVRRGLAPAGSRGTGFGTVLADLDNDGSLDAVVVNGRVAAGKPPTGRLTIAARHAGGSIAINVKDDGRGIDPAKVAAVAVRRGLISEIVGRFEQRGFGFRGMRLLLLDRATAEQHYAEHRERPFFGELVDFITSGPIVAMVLEGVDAVKAARQVIGATNPLEASTGSIRGDFAIETGRNMVHGSDSPESAARESALFFGDLV